MKPWEVYEKHETEVRGIFKQLGFTDKKGRVRRFDGKAFWPEMEKTGHTSVDFWSCECCTKEVRKYYARKVPV